MNYTNLSASSMLCECPSGGQENTNPLLNATILMVDDEPITMEVIQAFLEESGYRHFVLVDDPATAMQAIELHRPDLLLLDLMMPEISGFDILKSLRAHSKFKHLPVLILSASSEDTDKLGALELGATDFLSKPVDPSELQLRVRNTLAAKAYMDQLTFYDPLTQLPNRYLFLEHLEWTLNNAKCSKEPFALLSIEIDQFDRINDTIGLSAGDNVLQRLAKRIGSVAQDTQSLGDSRFDADTGINLFHFDGGVFNLIIQHLLHERDSATMAQRLLEAVKMPIQVDGNDLYVTASIGVSTYPAETADSAAMLQLASGARDHVRENGGNGFQFSSRKISLNFKQRLGLESRLRKAILRNELTLNYQPKVDVSTNTIAGVEALLRWEIEGHGTIPPCKFIPIAEETGLITPIGEWVLENACQQLAAWKRAGKAEIGMAVNLSPAQFDDPDMPDRFKRIIEDSRIDPQCLTLEVTESMLLQDIDEKIEILHRLKNLGVKLAIDDFGTGFSSFSYLCKLPLDELKIDRSFVSSLFEEPKGRAVVGSLIHLSHSLDLYTVAEGVETEEQLRFLKNHDCDQYQGYLFSKPKPAFTMEKMLAQTARY